MPFPTTDEESSTSPHAESTTLSNATLDAQATSAGASTNPSVSKWARPGEDGPSGNHTASLPNGEQPSSTVAELPSAALALAARLFDAARQGNNGLLKQALEGGLKPNMTNEKGDSLLMLSSYHGHLATVKLLLEHGADPNTLNDRGQSPLAGVVFKNERSVASALVQAGADPDRGEPSARETAAMFRMGDDWTSLFEGRDGETE